MARTNGKSEIEPQRLDTEHELPASDDATAEVATAAADAPATQGRDDELARLRAERDSLVDRLARLQAEFENARKRAAREQQEFREYALSDAFKALLPILDSFERALEIGAGERSEFHSGV